MRRARRPDTTAPEPAGIPLNSRGGVRRSLGADARSHPPKMPMAEELTSRPHVSLTHGGNTGGPPVRQNRGNLAASRQSRLGPPGWHRPCVRGARRGETVDTERYGSVTEIEPPAEPARILVVDAYGHSREGLSASLRVGGYRVETAAGSWGAIQKAKDGHCGVAIIDVDLPPAHGVVVSGWDLARIFRAFHPGAAIILVTAEWRPDLAQAEGLHRARLVEKPIHPGELRALVKALQSEGVGAVEAADRMKSEERRASWGTPGR